MSDQTPNAFGDPAPAGDPTPPISNTPTIEDQLKSIVNEDGTPKYKDVETAIASLSASQEYIKKLETEAREREEKATELAKKAAEATALEEIVEKLRQPNQEPNGQTTVANGLDEESAKQLFNNLLQETSVKQTQEQNLQQVNDQLVSKYGEKAADVVAEKAKELGVTVPDLMEQSRKAPKSVLAYFGELPKATATPTTSNTLGVPQPRVVNNDELFEGILTKPNQTKNMVEAMKAVRKEIYEKYGIEQN